MASTYLTQKEAEYKLLAQQEKNQISSDMQNQIYQIQRGHKRPGQATDSIPVGCVGSVVICALLTGGTAIGGGAVLLMAIIVTIVITAVVHSMRKSNTDTHNAGIDRRIEDLRRQEQAQHRAVDEKYARMLEQESARFRASVKSSRSKYGGHTAAQPIVKWLSERFEKEILAADRRSHMRNIEVVFAFRVDANQVATLKKVGTNNQYGNAELFDFNVNRFSNLYDFEDRVGFSQAMAKLVQFEMMRRFPKDPILPSHGKPTIVITSDDALMELRYQVPNPNFRHAVSL